MKTHIGSANDPITPEEAQFHLNVNGRMFQGWMTKVLDYILRQFCSFVTWVHFVQVNGMAELTAYSQFFLAPGCHHPSKPWQILAKSQSLCWMPEIAESSRAQTQKAPLRSTARPLRLTRGMLTSPGNTAVTVNFGHLTTS